MLNESIGAQGINPSVVVGALIIKHLESCSGRETVQHIQESMYLQYFLSFSSLVKEPILHSSCFVDFRKRMDLQAFEELNTAIVKLSIPPNEVPQQADKKVMADG